MKNKIIIFAIQLSMGVYGMDRERVAGVSDSAGGAQSWLVAASVDIDALNALKYRLEAAIEAVKHLTAERDALQREVRRLREMIEAFSKQ